MKFLLIVGAISALFVIGSSVNVSQTHPSLPPLFTSAAESDHLVNQRQVEEKAASNEINGKIEGVQLTDIIKSIKFQITEALKEVINQILNQLKVIANDLRKRLLIKLSKVTLSEVFTLMFGGISELMVSPIHQQQPYYSGIPSRPHVQYNNRPNYNLFRNNANKIDLFNYQSEFEEGDEEEEDVEDLASYKSAHDISFKKVEIEDDVKELASYKSADNIAVNHVEKEIVTEEEKTTESTTQDGRDIIDFQENGWLSSDNNTSSDV